MRAGGSVDETFTTLEIYGLEDRWPVCRSALGFDMFDGLDFSIHHQAELAPRRAREAIDEI